MKTEIRRFVVNGTLALFMNEDFWVQRKEDHGYVIGSDKVFSFTSERSSQQRGLAMRNVVIAGYLRTAQSRSRPNDPARDWFHKIRSDELLVKLLPELIKRTGINAEEIDDFIVGSALGVS